MKTRRNFFKSLVACAAVAFSCPSIAIDSVADFSQFKKWTEPSPAWENFYWKMHSVYAFMPQQNQVMPILHMIESGHGKGGSI